MMLNDGSRRNTVFFCFFQTFYMLLTALEEILVECGSLLPGLPFL